MSLLHPTEEDNALAAGHASAGWNKAIRRCMRLRQLLERARKFELAPAVNEDIDAALKTTFYDESEAFPPSGWEKTT